MASLGCSEGASLWFPTPDSQPGSPPVDFESLQQMCADFETVFRVHCNAIHAKIADLEETKARNPDSWPSEDCLPPFPAVACSSSPALLSVVEDTSLTLPDCSSGVSVSPMLPAVSIFPSETDFSVPPSLTFVSGPSLFPDIPVPPTLPDDLTTISFVDDDTLLRLSSPVPLLVSTMLDVSSVLKRCAAMENALSVRCYAVHMQCVAIQTQLDLLIDTEIAWQTRPRARVSKSWSSVGQLLLSPTVPSPSAVPSFFVSADVPAFPSWTISSDLRDFSVAPNSPLVSVSPCLPVGSGVPGLPAGSDSSVSPSGLTSILPDDLVLPYLPLVSASQDIAPAIIPASSLDVLSPTSDSLSQLPVISLDDSLATASVLVSADVVKLLRPALNVTFPFGVGSPSLLRFPRPHGTLRFDPDPTWFRLAPVRVLGTAHRPLLALVLDFAADDHLCSAAPCPGGFGWLPPHGPPHCPGLLDSFWPFSYASAWLGVSSPFKWVPRRSSIVYPVGPVVPSPPSVVLPPEVPCPFPFGFRGPLRPWFAWSSRHRIEETLLGAHNTKRKRNTGLLADAWLPNVSSSMSTNFIVYLLLFLIVFWGHLSSRVWSVLGWGDCYHPLDGNRNLFIITPLVNQFRGI